MISYLTMAIIGFSLGLFIGWFITTPIFKDKRDFVYLTVSYIGAFVLYFLMVFGLIDGRVNIYG